MIEKILFTIIALILFIIIFLKMIQKNSTNYTYILIAQGVGLIIKLIEFLCNIKIPLIITICCWIISIVIPLIIVLIEKKGMNFEEIIYILYAVIIKEEEQKKQIILKIVEKHPNSFYAHKMLAEIYEKQGKYEVAAIEYGKALDQRKNDYVLSYKIANALSNINKKDESVKILNELLKQKPDYYEASKLLVDILYEQENFKEAITVCQIAIKYRPGDYDLYYNLGMLHTRLNDFQTAKEYYEKAAQINSYLYNSKYNLGQILLIYNEIEEAEKYFMECINANYMEEGSYYYLAYIEMLKGDKENAIRYLNVAVEENTKYYEKAKKEIVFRLIFKYIKKPTKDKEKKDNITTKEEQTILHLEQTYELVGNLNNNDLKAMKTMQRDDIKEKE